MDNKFRDFVLNVMAWTVVSCVFVTMIVLCFVTIIRLLESV